MDDQCSLPIVRSEGKLNKFFTKCLTSVMMGREVGEAGISQREIHFSVRVISMKADIKWIPEGQMQFI